MFGRLSPSSVTCVDRPTEILTGGGTSAAPATPTGWPLVAVPQTSMRSPSCSTPTSCWGLYVSSVGRADVIDVLRQQVSVSLEVDVRSPAAERRQVESTIDRPAQLASMLALRMEVDASDRLPAHRSNAAPPSEPSQNPRRLSDPSGRDRQSSTLGKSSARDPRLGRRYVRGAALDERLHVRPRRN